MRKKSKRNGNGSESARAAQITSAMRALSGAASRATSDKLDRMASLHLVGAKLPGPDGTLTSVVFRDEGKWEIDVLPIQIGGPPQTQSGLVIAADPRAARQQVQMIPMPVWRVWIRGKDGRVAAFVVPFNQAFERAPQRVLKSEEGEHFVPLDVYDKAVRDAALERGGAVSQ